MTATQHARRFIDHPLGYVALLLVEVAVIYTGLVLYPSLGTVVWWAAPSSFVSPECGSCTATERTVPSR